MKISLKRKSLNRFYFSKKKYFMQMLVFSIYLLIWFFNKKKHNKNKWWKSMGVKQFGINLVVLFIFFFKKIWYNTMDN